MSFDDFPETPFYLHRAPLVQVLQIAYYDFQNTETILYKTYLPVDTTTTTGEPEETIGESDFIIDTRSEPGRVALAYGVYWPTVTLRLIDSVRIQYRVGYGPQGDTTPDTVKDAIALYCTWRNENRTAESGTIPRQFYDLLNPERIFYP
jgi:hypothetical protein